MDNQTETVVKLDLGCGKNKQPGFIGVDKIPFDGVDVVLDIGICRLPYDDNSVEEIHSSHFVEHLTQQERVHLFNEIYRVLKPEGTARIITPHWSHERAYGDPTHQWPAIGSWFYFYLHKGWREANAPHADYENNKGLSGYNCDFDYVLAGCHDPNDVWVATRSMEAKTVMMSRNLNTTTDLIATLTKKVR